MPTIDEQWQADETEDYRELLAMAQAHGLAPEPPTAPRTKITPAEIVVDIFVVGLLLYCAVWCVYGAMSGTTLGR
jgi:hypothetical protein